MSKEYTAVSLFSGAGGMDLGVHQAGFSILAQIEQDQHCCETLRAAQQHSQSTLFEEDITKLTVEAVMGEIKLKPGELTLLFGGPPCQSFSQIGKRRSLDDARGLLIFEIIRFAKVFQPKFILIEQVKGFLSSNGDGKTNAFMLFYQGLTEIGYSLHYKILCSADYGVAQLRDRLFLVATRDKHFHFPLPTHISLLKKNPLFPLPAYVTAGEVLLNLPPIHTDKTIYHSHVDITPNGDKCRIKGVPEGGHLSNQFHLPDSQRKRLGIKDTTKFRRIHRNFPSITLRCGEIFFHRRSGVVKNLDQHR
jgi:DNA (cytosine-5)-methyltransferase 1